MNNNDNETNNGSTGGILERFRQRLNKIRLERMSKKKYNPEENEEFIKNKVDEIKRVIWEDKKQALIKEQGIQNEEKFKTNPYRNPMNRLPKKGIAPQNNNTENKNRFITNDFNEPKEEIPPKENLITEENKSKKEEKIELENTIINKGIEEEKKEKENNSQETTEQKEQIEKSSIKKDISDSKKREIKEAINDSNLINKRKDELKSKIIKKIKGDFNKKLAELEILENELYNLKEKNEDEIELEKIKIIKGEIESIIKKINNIIAEYNIYRADYNLDNSIDLKDTILIDDIIEYKFIVENEELKKDLVKDYKLLEEFKLLYNKLDNIKELSNEIINSNQNKLSYLEEKNINHENIKSSINELDRVVSKCDDEIKNQDIYLKEIMEKINKIDVKEYTKLKYNNLSKIFDSSITFLATLSITKSAPIIPRIFMNTLATNLLIRNVYQSLQPERVTELKYSTINYDKEISGKITDINYTSKLISDTLYTIGSLKENFLSQYNSSIPGYIDTLNKITKIEDEIIKNQYKVETIKIKLAKNKEKNQEKMLKLENLNKNN